VKTIFVPGTESLLSAYSSMFTVLSIVSAVGRAREGIWLVNIVPGQGLFVRT
jgi:hypothetical protein